jgi:hypothetical protein
MYLSQTPHGGPDKRLCENTLETPDTLFEVTKAVPEIVLVNYPYPYYSQEKKSRLP